MSDKTEQVSLPVKRRFAIIVALHIKLLELCLRDWAITEPSPISPLQPWVRRPRISPTLADNSILHSQLRDCCHWPEFLSEHLQPTAHHESCHPYPRKTISSWLVCTVPSIPRIPAV